MRPKELLAIRCILALVWLYNGLYLKLILIDPKHLQVVEAVGQVGPLSPQHFLMLIGAGETLLGLAILSSWFYPFLCLFQLALVILMNLIGSLSGGVTDPIALVVTNLPFLACIYTAYRCGPGSLKNEP